MTPFSCYCKRTTLNEVLSILNSLKENKSVGTYGIPSEVLKISSSVIGPYLVQLVNESLGQGIFPNCLKTATVKPLFKSDDHQNLNNYRPISVVSVISKVFERVVHNRIYAFSETFKLLSDSQNGYRSKRSTVDAIVSITEKNRDKNSAVQQMCFLGSNQSLRYN